METYTAARDLVENPRYPEQRQKALKSLDIKAIDIPIRDIIRGFALLPYCFTLQSCYGHFLHDLQKESDNTTPLPTAGQVSRVEYRIAYIAFCVENSEPGRKLLDDFSGIPAKDADYIQFGSAHWFWNKQVNTYVLQVEPYRFRMRDRITVDLEEALHIEGVRNRFFIELKTLLESRL